MCEYRGECFYAKPECAKKERGWHRHCCKTWSEVNNPEAKVETVEPVYVAGFFRVGAILDEAKNGKTIASECAQYHRKNAAAKKREYSKTLLGGDFHGFQLEMIKEEIDMHERFANFMAGVATSASDK